MKNDPMGKDHVHKGGGSLTEDSIEHMAKEWGMSVEDTKKEMLAMLKLELNEKS